VEKHGRPKQTTDENIIERMRFACWIAKATNTHLEYVIFLSLPWQQWLRESSQRYVTHTFPIFLFSGDNREHTLPVC
jgi:hypothetical protein